MSTVQIVEGVTLTASEETCQQIQNQIEEFNWFRYEALDELKRAYDSGDWDYYSDLHKDMYGVRP